MKISDYDVVPAPAGTTRLIPSRFPPIRAFDAVTTHDDLAAVMDLEGWTNDRLVKPRMDRLPQEEWVYGRPNASVVMAAFLHGSPGGLRFSGASLGAWYGSTHLTSAMLKVANGLRKEIAVSALTQKSESYRQYKADLAGDYVDIFGAYPEFHDPDDASYPAPQAFGQRIRAEGVCAGIRYESVRHPGHENWVCFRPSLVRNVMQADHFKIEVPQTGSVVVRQLS
ncbi:RES family NAD+ phosphorylase [Loktanella sp. TSTF-M6]|uniref:RES family NAD+ phosphorylase n=1 Tax=Loktanella gaetbuli TaxID=2881335 RepID=A0ABS8BXP5_9RHOB|nr:RES family NAD+ phosphorylase [Loktanella gaetbuli]MCB5200507.1 RES family NAD+ phosphorylase [Loktanella gaetbuli]